MRYQDDQGREASLPADWVVIALGYQAAQEPPQEIQVGVPLHPLPFCAIPQGAYRAAQEGARLARSL